MFPLGTVLYPGMVLPLNVFEPRYLKMVGYCLDHEYEFGVVLITRGQETGGGDERAKVATISRILDVASLPDGRCTLRTAGVRRVRVTSWYPDDPFPQAEVEDWPDDPYGATIRSVDPDLVVAKVTRLLQASGRLGRDNQDPVVELGRDAVAASYHAAALAPIDTHDQLRLLSAEGPADRWALLDEMMDEQIDIFRFNHGGEAI